MVVEPKN